jgi:hypothetical protein
VSNRRLLETQLTENKMVKEVDQCTFIFNKCCLGIGSTRGGRGCYEADWSDSAQTRHKRSEDQCQQAN